MNIHNSLDYVSREQLPVLGCVSKADDHVQMLPQVDQHWKAGVMDHMPSLYELVAKLCFLSIKAHLHTDA